MCLKKDSSERSTAQELLLHQWLSSSSREVEPSLGLNQVSKNLAQFSLASNFQKTIISMLAGLKVQQEELATLRDAFFFLDTN